MQKFIVFFFFKGNIKTLIFTCFSLLPSFIWFTFCHCFLKCREPALFDKLYTSTSACPEEMVLFHTMTRQAETIAISIAASLCSSSPVSTGHFEQNICWDSKMGFSVGRCLMDMTSLKQVQEKLGENYSTWASRKKNIRMELQLHQYHWERPVHVTSVIMSASHLLKFAAIYWYVYQSS